MHQLYNHIDETRHHYKLYICFHICSYPLEFNLCWEYVQRIIVNGLHVEHVFVQETFLSLSVVMKQESCDESNLYMIYSVNRNNSFMALYLKFFSN